MIVEKNHDSLKHLKPDQRQIIMNYMTKFNDRYKNGKWIVSDKIEEFSIDFIDNNIPFAKPYTYYGAELEFLRKQVQEWLDLGIIRKSNSKYAVPLIVSSKIKLGGEIKFRACPNYIPINQKIQHVIYPMPTVHELLDKAKGIIKCKIDLKSAHNAIGLRFSDWEKSAFITQHLPGLGDHFEFTCMPWGTNNSGRYFQFVIENILRSNEVFPKNLKGDYCDVMQDDILVWADNEDEMLIILKDIFDRLYYYGFLG